MRRPADVFLLYAARAARGFGDGFAIIILPAYLSELGFGPFQIGIVASAALLGTAALTLAIGFLAPGRDLRNRLLVGAFATVATGLAFPATEQCALILVIAFVGTMNPSSGEIGLFVPLEHAMLARAAPDHDRTRIFAHYSLIGGLSSAAGALAAAAPTALVSAGVSNIGALKAMFYCYAALGLVAAGIYRYLPHAQPLKVASRGAPDCAYSSLCHAIEAEAATPSNITRHRLTLESPSHGVRVFSNDREQHLGRLIGTVCALLPVSHGPEREVEPRRKLFLRQVQLLAERADSRHTTSARELRLGRWHSIWV
jgi:MFS family permease